MKLEDMDWVIDPNTGNKVDMKKLLEEQHLAQVYLDTNFPFFATLLAQLKFVYSFQVPTQATDGTRIIVNPSFTAPLSIRMKAFVMLHEIMHCALDHMARGKNHEPNMSNVAADYEVNQLIIKSGTGPTGDTHPFTEADLKKLGALLDKKYDGMNYEMIYASHPSAPSNNQPQRGGQQGGKQGQQQKGNGSGGGGGNNNPSPDFVDGWNKALEDYKAGRVKL